MSSDNLIKQAGQASKHKAIKQAGKQAEAELHCGEQAHLAAEQCKAMHLGMKQVF